MNFLIRKAKITDPNSPHNGKIMDVLVENGAISQLGASIKTDKQVKVIEHENLHLSPGWFDMQACFCDPGFEYKEDLQSGMHAAASGGFTGVCIMPNTNPPLQSKAGIEYVLNAAKNNIVDVFPSGCLTVNSEGKEMTELFDMKQAGAVAFTDYKTPVKDAGLLVRLLQYAENTGTLIITHCEEKSLSGGGQMNEGEASTRLGLKGIPSLAEEIMLQRNIHVLSYAGGKLHVPTVSSKLGADHIKQAKNRGLTITAGIAAHQLLLQDHLLESFDTNLKLIPPLRDKNETEALKKALLNDSIDVIVSDHCPEDTESKDVEFDHAAFGMIALETAYAAANTALHGKITPDKLVEKLSINPRKILGIKVPVIKAGEEANLTLFNPDKKWIFEKKHIASKSKNTPLVGYEFTGKTLGVINNGKYVSCT